MAKFLGIVMAPSAVQYEGLDQVLDNIAATGAQAICTSLGLSLPAEPGRGHREPPLDIDGWERLLDRPLWGKRELWLQGYRTHEVDEALFAATPYRPGGALAPVELDRDLPHKILAAAHARALRANVQISPTVVPGLRAEDQPHGVDGSLPVGERRVARQGCLNNPAVRAYALALVRDTVRHYPEADGLFLDWAEYTVYDLTDHFGCTCPHCAEAAMRAGHDWARIRRDVLAAWEAAHRLTARDLERLQRLATRPGEVLELVQRYPGWLDFLRFKAETVVELYRAFRQAMDEEGGAQMELGANGWCPPFSRSTGMDYRALAGVVQSVRPKLFTFHWSALPRWYGQTLLAWNPTLSERQVLDTLVEVFDLPDHNAPRSFAQYHIPAPEEDHPATPDSWRIKIDEVVDQVGGRVPCHILAHSYRSEAQWKRMIAVCRDSRAEGMWVQRYDYLSDAKLEALRGMWR
jgi:hypothetical protein